MVNATIIDSRVNIPAIVTASGYEVKAYVDTQTALVTSMVLPYKLETGDGALIGYVYLSVNATGTACMVLKKQLRPAFVQFDDEISQEISSFIQSNAWQMDYLF